MESFVVLYKDGEVSPPLHPIDAKGWMTLGWSNSPEIEVKVSEKVAVEKPAARKTKAEG
jgi:hypothetical protein